MSLLKGKADLFDRKSFRMDVGKHSAEYSYLQSFLSSQASREENHAHIHRSKPIRKQKRNTTVNSHLLLLPSTHLQICVSPILHP